ncbi:hypothetical protein GIS00_25250 [Nakamurella sp. YIM 132087]|uniref:Uncharacterized protein n=1 Tax=Nakamurella alba TaxID=2665158 RepID=A0A7K1FSV9_9ACTN|nr:hypothetical protein [Nakamurella alba]MTD17242.1 hypothetical protein [Nakamurella alba]
MNVELLVWIVVAVLIVVVALWPVLRRNRRRGSAISEVEARALIENLENALDGSGVDPRARRKAERNLLLAGAAMSGTGRGRADRAGRWAKAGLRALGG